MEVLSAQELDSLKYSELQKVAKKAGLKANLKADKLLKTLKQHFQHEPKLENDSQKSKEKRKPPFRRTGSGRKRKRCQADDIPDQQIDPECTEVMSTEKNHTEGNADGNIPQNMDFSSKHGHAVMKASTTPDFKKLHEAHFKKMESIDKYMERKQKRFDAIGSSIREVKILVEKSSLLKPPEEKTPGCKPKKPNTRVSLFSPLPHKGRHSFICTPASHRHSPRFSINVANRSILTDKCVLKTSIFSSSKMNVRFSEATKDNEHKRSLTKTPARKSPYNNPNTPSSQQKSGKPVSIKKSEKNLTNSETTVEKSKPAALTPFKFAAENVLTPATNKLMFDLKASLARPLSYQPHKGKLKPWRNSQENPDALNKSASLKKDYKQHRLQTREERREIHVKGRKQNKDKMLGAYRGLAMA
ncbi:nucleolar and spindle-associated protein 1 isoform X2 [Rhinatrema bivittatum]|uniref:nucleolar and spindle-associated protein 1 isoform X2 n=1 Tax=Rhinatrema bivittatum TaxID=194408 RepID=UPI00112EA943|nr:nucleolar and spindle-associated protein 1 isoform X2 [Rhinatrema bivittatum]